MAVTGEKICYRHIGKREDPGNEVVKLFPVSCSLLLRMATMDMAKFQIERGWVRVDYYLINNTRPI